MKLRAIRDIDGIIRRNKGDVFDYKPWCFQWQGMSERERVDKGVYVHCFGHGEFEVLRDGIDVRKVM